MRITASKGKMIPCYDKNEVSEMVMDPDTLTSKTVEGQPGPEVSEAFVAAADKIVSNAKAEVRKRFESPENSLDYHRLKHTEAVIQRTGSILEAMGANERQRMLGKIAAGGHDIVQKGQAVEQPIILESGHGTATEVPRILRQRAVGRNEQESAKETVEAMRRHNEEAGKEIFTQEDMAVVEEAILATIPAFESGVVLQPNLTTESHPVAVATALADLGEAGMAGPNGFIAGSNAEFREVNVDIKKTLEGARETGEALGDETKAQYRQRMLIWSRGQLGFVGARKELFESDIAALSDNQKEAVRGLFSHFDETISYAGEVIQGREKMAFEELALDMGYDLGPGH